MNRRLDLIAPTPRRKMTRSRRVKIFLAANGICCVCGVQIRDGEQWDIEHPDALALGGSDDDSALRPVHFRCHKIKSKRDAGAKAKRDRIIDAGYAGKRKRGFRKAAGAVYDWRLGRYVRPTSGKDGDAQTHVET